MLIKIINLLLGFVDFTFSGGFADGFVNDCYNQKINIKNIVRLGSDIKASCGAAAYKRLYSVALKNGGRLKIVKKHGLPFLLRPFRTRWGILAGLLFFVAFNSFMGGFIWNITAVGGNALQQGMVVDYLAQNGFKTGARWSNTDKENLEFSVLANFSDVAWISINKFGCLAQIEIRQTTPKPAITNNTVITNVKAKKAGVIVSVTALGGWQSVEPGEAVLPGDLLISGIYDGGESAVKNHFAHAHGTVFAKTEEKITVNIAREQTEKEYIGSKSYKTLCLFGLRLPLYIIKNSENAQIETSQKYIELNSFRLPIGVYTEKCTYYSKCTRRLSDSELEALAREELEKRKSEQFASCEILGESIEFSADENGGALSAEYSLLEDIGVETEIAINNSQSGE